MTSLEINCPSHVFKPIEAKPEGWDDGSEEEGLPEDQEDDDDDD